MLEALTSPNPRLAANVSVYGLPVPLMMDSGSLIPLLNTILAPAFAAPKPGSSPDGQVSTLAPFRAAAWLLAGFLQPTVGSWVAHAQSHCCTCTPVFREHIMTLQRHKHGLWGLA